MSLCTGLYVSFVSSLFVDPFLAKMVYTVGISDASGINIVVSIGISIARPCHAFDVAFCYL